MATYFFNLTDDGIFGKAFEMAIKDALNRKNANSVSPCGVADMRYNRRNYDIKQNGSCVRYSPTAKYIKGSNRVIYATHISYTKAIIDNQIAITVDLAETQMFVLDRYEFIDFLKSINGIKLNLSRGTANIQTGYNYKKDCYHGRKAHLIEQWAYEHELDDGVIDDILEAVY